MTYVGERLEVREAIDQLEAILREVAEEVSSWRARALKAEAEVKAAGGGGGVGGSATRRAPTPADPEVKNRVADLESENKVLRLRVEAARVRVHDLLERLTFLEEQARGNGGSGSGPR